MGLIPRFSCFAEVPILIFVRLTQGKEEVWSGETWVRLSLCYSKSEIIYVFQDLDLYLQEFSGQNTIFDFYSSPL